MIFEILKKIGFPNEVSSILRRFFAIGIFAGLSAIIVSYIEIAPVYLIPLLTAFIAALDKSSRAYKK